MSHLDPYGSAEPRGWDRSDRPPALPWPERGEVEPWSPRQAGPELSAAPQAPPRPPVRRHDEPNGGPYDVPAGDRLGGDRVAGLVPPLSGGAAPHSPPPVRDDDAPTAQLTPVRDDDAPTAHLTPVRDDEATAGHLAPVRDGDAPTAQLAPVRDEDRSRPAFPAADVDPAAVPTPGRRSPGRRRAGPDRPPTQLPSAGRAGRDLPAAIGVGLGLGALVLVPLFFFLPGFLAVLAGAIGVGIWEMTRAVRRSGAHPPLVPLLAGGVLTIGLAWFAGPDALSLGLLVTVLGTMVWRLGDGPAGFQRDLTAATLIAVYVPFLGGFAAMLAAAPGDGHLRVLVTVVGVVLSDTGGYAAGVTFGKHPMAPRISPKKSWEGFAGSVAAAALGSALLIWLLFDVAPWWGALFGVAVSGAAVLGDLAESMIKRDLGVKDMSSLLPGHGGLMDRLDSILFAVPTAYLLLAVLVPVVG
ncbi:phosphatidate cytidylyltransferase [Micromonospora rifamycinica]|uniref:phosphatidate cytidylyltransferase n=1 Tax=Micromonospora rifamycinica TaxID=291594 RepID=UPI0034125E59